MDKRRDLQRGDIVQLSPETNFPCCLMLVTEPKVFGAQGFVAMPQNLGELPNQAYFRANWEDMEYIGPAVWIPPPIDGTDEE